PCPYGTGAHPYLTVGTQSINTAVLATPALAWLPHDVRGIPDGSRLSVAGTQYDFRVPRRIGDVVLDTAFTRLQRDPDGLARVHLCSENNNATTVWFDESYAYLMLFT